VTRNEAIERVEKLRRITVKRGATAHEQESARARAAAIIARYGLDGSAARAAGVRTAVAAPAAAYGRSTRTDRRASGSRRFVAFA
jgi:hypothetical protein